MEFPNRATEDFICVKGNGKPLFALANVVDDRTMAISHVFRGEEHLPNTPKQIMLWHALNEVTSSGLPLPVFAHLPLLVNEQGKKLSKRRDPVAVEMYREQGYLPSAFRNYLALLGWSPGEEEIVPLATLIERFRIEDVQSSPAFFDVRKLSHMNGVYIRELPTSEFIELSLPWVDPRPGEWAAGQWHDPDSGASRHDGPAVAGRAFRSRCLRPHGRRRAGAGGHSQRGPRLGGFLLRRQIRPSTRTAGRRPSAATRWPR